ncbi:MAG: hypothetical protein PHQ43_05950 [Dehalococcoidales bacterium]|nr:hypothetical protein [Dehalococcoidales bacterium]
MKRLLFPPLALVFGFADAFLASGIHSIFFALLPLAAFALGYFSSWRLGLICGFLLLAGSSFGGALIWHGGTTNLFVPIQYFAAFFAGGFSLFLLGALGPALRSPRKMLYSVVAITVLALTVLGCSYAALSPNSYYYQVTVGSSENLEEVVLYVPAPTRDGNPYGALLGHRYYASNVGLTQDYTTELVETEYGTTLKITIRGLVYQKHPELPYRANLILWQKNAFSWDILRLSPKSDVVPLQIAEPPTRLWPILTHQSRTIERFNVPVMIRSSTAAQVEVTLRNRTDRGSAIGFAFGKSDPYTEYFRYSGKTSDEWVSVPAEARTVFDIRGVSD